MKEEEGDKKQGKGGRKKCYDRGAFLTLQKVKKAHRELLDLPIKKSERDPITKHLKDIGSYLEKRAYSMPANIKRNVEEEASKEILPIFKHWDIIKKMVIKGYDTRAMQKYIYQLSGELVHLTSMRARIDKFKETDEFKQEQDKYLQSVDGLRLYTKVGRIEELTDLYNDIKDKYEIAPTTAHQTQMMKILDQARRESDSPAVYNFKMEQNNMQINGSVVFNLLDKEVEREVFKKMPLNEIIIGRLAARSKVNPVLMMKRLHESYYAAQAGMGGLNDLDKEIRYPSELHYDIEDMVSKNKKIVIEEAKVIEEASSLDENISKLKQQLLDKIRAKKDGK